MILISLQLNMLNIMLVMLLCEKQKIWLFKTKIRN